MAEYLHGAYGQTQAAGSRVSSQSRSAICYIGTAPAHLVQGGSQYINKPVLISSIAEARAKLGYSEDFEKYTLCEAMNVHFNQNGVGPLIMINVFDPAEHKHAAGNTDFKSLPAEGGRIVIHNADNVIVDSITLSVVTVGDSPAIFPPQFTASYNASRNAVILTEKVPGSFDVAQYYQVQWDTAAPEEVTAEEVIGTSDGYGKNTGICALANVYQETGYVPAFVAAPGYSGIPEVNRALTEKSQKINGHWDAYVLADLPLKDSKGAVTLAGAAAWKLANGYTAENETVYFPMAKGVDGKKYHLSTLAAANLQKLLTAQDGIPYKTASNTECSIIANLYLDETGAARSFDDSMINAALNQNGIASAAFVGGKWVIWGAHSADYNADNADAINVAETNRMMLFYISNDFQARRAANVDKPLTGNDLQSIVAEEQSRLDALKMIGALLYGECHLNAEMDDRSDIASGDFSITFNVTTTPLAKSLTAVVNWTEDGFVSYYESFSA